MTRHRDPPEFPVRELATLWAFGGLAALLRLVFLAIVGRRLDAEQFADFGPAYALSLVLMVLAGGYGSAVTRSAAAARPGPTQSGTRAPHLMIFGGLGILAGGWLCQQILGVGSPWPGGVAVMAGLVMLPVEALRGNLRAEGRFGLLGANLAGESLARACLAALLLVWHPTAASALLAMVLATTLLGLPGAHWLTLPRRLLAPQFWRPTWPPHLGPFLLLAVIGALWQQADLLVVKRTLPTTSAADYAGVSALAKGIGVLFLPFAYSSLPRWARMHAGGESILRDVARVTVILWVLSLPVIAVAGVLGVPIVSAIVGTDHSGAAEVLPVLLLGLTIVFTLVILAQSSVALGGFQFLWLYGAGFLLEVLVLLRAESVSAIAWTSAAVPAGTLLAAVPIMIPRLSRR